MEVGKIRATAVAVPAPRRVVSPEDKKSVWDLEALPSPLRGWSSHLCNSMTAIVIGGNARCEHPLLMGCANIAIQLGQGGAAIQAAKSILVMGDGSCFSSILPCALILASSQLSSAPTNKAKPVQYSHVMSAIAAPNVP